MTINNKAFRSYMNRTRYVVFRPIINLFVLNIIQPFEEILLQIFPAVVTANHVKFCPLNLSHDFPST